MNVQKHIKSHKFKPLYTITTYINTGSIFFPSLDCFLWKVTKRKTLPPATRATFKTKARVFAKRSM